MRGSGDWGGGSLDFLEAKGDGRRVWGTYRGQVTDLPTEG